MLCVVTRAKSAALKLSLRIKVRICDSTVSLTVTIVITRNLQCHVIHIFTVAHYFDHYSDGVSSHVSEQLDEPSLPVSGMLLI